MNRKIEERLEYLKTEIDRSLDEVFSRLEVPSPTLKEAMVYSVMGGKRLRGAILLDNFSLMTESIDKAQPFACGVEMIHAYSLVHDDLPPLDNDDFRRGKLSCHKKYGEAMGLLCGDALLTLAFQVMLSAKNLSCRRVLRTAKEIASCAGPLGLVSGQALDMELEGRKAGLDRVKEMYRLKTAALFRACAGSGLFLGGASPFWVKAAFTWGEEFGYAFQILDDLEDLGALGKEEYKDTFVKETSFLDSLATAEKAIEVSLSALKPLLRKPSLMEALSLHYAQEIERLRRQVKVE